MEKNTENSSVQQAIVSDDDTEKDTVCLSRCIACNSNNLQEQKNLQDWSLVSSDCRSYQGDARLAYCPDCGTIQKIKTAGWLNTIADIYETYQIYHQANGAEQEVFDAEKETMVSRSSFLLNRLINQVAIPDHGKVLDFGCGNGALLKSFHQLKPDWFLVGADLKEEFFEPVEGISSKAQYYMGDLSELEGSFDMITLLHCLEHITEPLEILHQLKEKLTEDGLLYIQVPNVAVNPYDLLIFDHVLHFTPQTLINLVSKAGFSNICILSDTSEKEISLVASVRPFKSQAEFLSHSTEVESNAPLKHHIQVLEQSLETYSALTKEKSKIGIFGTSIAGTWLAETSKTINDFFVDEDQNRVGSEYLGKAILHPSQVSQDSIVFMPLPAGICQKIVGRLDPQERVYRYLK